MAISQRHKLKVPSFLKYKKMVRRNAWTASHRKRKKTSSNNYQNTKQWKEYSLVCACMFCMNKRFLSFLLSHVRHGHWWFSIADYYFSFFFLFLWTCALLILHPSQQVDCASITSYIYTHAFNIICIPQMKKKQKQLKKTIPNSLFTT